MSGASRVDWKHGIRKQPATPSRPPPPWNPFDFRRSLTLRATKAYSDACLDAELAKRPGDTSLIDAFVGLEPQPLPSVLQLHAALNAFDAARKCRYYLISDC